MPKDKKKYQLVGPFWNCRGRFRQTCIALEAGLLEAFCEPPRLMRHWDGREDLDLTSSTLALHLQSYLLRRYLDPPNLHNSVCNHLLRRYLDP